MEKIDALLEKMDKMQEDVSFVKTRIELVDKHEAVLYGDPQKAAEGKCGLINQVAGQGRKLDDLQTWLRGAGLMITMAVSAFITGAVNLIFKSGK